MKIHANPPQLYYGFNADLIFFFICIFRELFNAAFVSCWSELTEQDQDSLIQSLQKALTSQDIPEIVQILLNLQSSWNTRTRLAFDLWPVTCDLITFMIHCILMYMYNNSSNTATNFTLFCNVSLHLAVPDPVIVLHHTIISPVILDFDLFHYSGILSKLKVFACHFPEVTKMVQMSYFCVSIVKKIEMYPSSKNTRTRLHLYKCAFYFYQLMARECFTKSDIESLLG